MRISVTPLDPLGYAVVGKPFQHILDYQMPWRSYGAVHRTASGVYLVQLNPRRIEAHPRLLPEVVAEEWVHAEDGDADHAVPITAAGWQKIVALIGEDAAIRVHDQLPREVRVKSFIPVMMQRTARVLYQHGWSNLWHYLAD